jgi:putative CocE/NonD family hydrolase
MAPAEILRRGRKQPELRKEFPAAIDDIDNLDQHVRRLPLVPFPPIDERAGGISPQFDQTVRGEFNQPMPRFRHSDVEVPAFVIAGWYDLFLQPDLEHFTALRESARTEEARRLTRLLVAPWSHGRADHTVGELDFGFRSGPLMIDLREDLNDLQRRWFDARLRGVNRGLDDEPRVRLFVMGINRWRDEEEWPLRRAREQQWHLHRDYRGEAPLQGHLMPASGGLDLTPPQEAEPSVFWLEPDDPVPTRGGAILMSPWYIKGPVDQLRTECRDDVLLFTSEPLRQPLEVTGRVKLVCWVAAETVDTDVVARLCDVHPDGRSFNLMDGILRLSYRNGTPQAERLNPGAVVRVEVDLWSTAHVFLPGHRLRLQVCASDFPRYDRNPGTGETSAIATRVLPQRNRLFHDPERPSHLLLPVVPA